MKFTKWAYREISVWFVVMMRVKVIGTPDVAHCYADVEETSPGASSLAYICVWRQSQETNSPGESPTNLWPPRSHMLSSQEHQFLTEIPWADSKQAGTSAWSGRGLCGETRLVWGARRATSAWPTAKPSQPPEPLGSAVVAHWHSSSLGRGAQRDHT